MEKKFTSILNKPLTKLFLPFLFFTFSFSSNLFAGAGIWEYYMSASSGNYGNYGGGTSWGGANLGMYDPNAAVLEITLNGVKTYQNNGDEIVAARVYYRVYHQDSIAPAYTSTDLPFFSNLPNFGDKEWQSTTVLNLFENVSAVGIYNVELYFEADGTYPGGTFNVYANNNTATAANPLKATFELTVALPIEFSAFEAFKADNAVVLEWSTASERNNDRFEIERANSDFTWEKIGTERSKKTNSVTATEYRFVDGSPKSGVNYYRLRQLDFGGEVSFSNIVKVDFGKSATIASLYPNPVASDKVFFDAKGETVHQVRIFDFNGRLLKTFAFDGTSDRELSLHGLPKGLLFVQFEDEKPLPLMRI